MNTSLNLEALKGAHVGNYAPSGRNVLINTDEDIAVQLAHKIYKRKIEARRKELDETFVPIYGRSLKFKEKDVSEIIFRIRKIEQECGKELWQVVAEIKLYTGVHTMYRVEQGKLIPVDGKRIKEAYEGIQQKKSIEQIKKILYL